MRIVLTLIAKCSLHARMRIVLTLIVKCSFVFLAMIAMFSLQGCEQLGMLNPKGLITFEERKLFFDTFALMLIVILPVIVMSFTFIYHYQVSHRIRDYKPHWGHNIFLESLWWGIPCVIIVILAILTWKKTFELDPYRSIPGYSQTMQIQVIALPYKWLFIYPEYNIATVNYLVIPVGQQVEYVMTGDNSAMSAFFIPQIGSQIYVMAGMRSRLHLVANHPGLYDGMNTQYNGGGFSDMHFTVNAVPPEKMQEWIRDTAHSTNHLTNANYLQLVTPSIENKPLFYSNVEKDLFDHVVDTYMHALGPTHPRGNMLAPENRQRHENTQLHDSMQPHVNMRPQQSMQPHENMQPQQSMQPHENMQPQQSMQPHKNMHSHDSMQSHKNTQTEKKI